MHASGYIITFFVLCGLVIEGLQEDVTTQVKCKTGKGIDGICSRRADCNLSTQNIDLTLYMPRGFKRICDVGDVCCPPKYIMKVQEPKPENDDFTFGEDD